MARGSGERTRARIKDAAAVLFRDQGIAGTSVREIAAAAEVDPALVIRHFGSKERLFLETMELRPGAKSPLFDVPLEQVGRRAIEFLLEFTDETRATYIALVRGSHEPAIAERLAAAHLDTFVGPLRDQLSGPDADLRARLAAALVGGLLYSMWVVGDETLLAADPTDVVDRYGALLQQLITPQA